MKIGEKVIVIDRPTMQRSIRDINKDGYILLWGYYDYIAPDKVKKVEKCI